MSEYSDRSLMPTPLHARTAELCSTNRWSSTCGFTLPQVFTTIAEEVQALTAGVAITDLSARLRWQIEGPDSGVFLDWMTSVDASKMEIGHTARALWCDDAGMVRGEGALARYSERKFEISTSIRDFHWFSDAVSGFDVRVANATGQRGGIGIQGPLAATVMAAAGFLSAPKATVGAISGEPGSVSQAWRQSEVSLVRDTSHGAFELWAQGDDAIVIWDKLMRAGAPYGLRPAGAEAWLANRMDMGVAIPGVDWLPVQFAGPGYLPHTLQELGVHLDANAKRCNGSQVKHSARPQRRLMLLSCESALPVGELTLKSASIGRVMSCAHAYERDRHLAMAWLGIEHCREGSVLVCQVAKEPKMSTLNVLKACYSI